MLQHSIEVSERTKMLCNISEIIDDLQTAFEEYKLKFDDDLSVEELDLIKEHYLEKMADFVEQKIMDSVHDSLEGMRYTI